MAKISEKEVARYAMQAGFKGRLLVRAVAISFAENRSHDTTAVSSPNRNGTVDVGLWQINSSNAPVEQMKDPAANAAKAYELSNNAAGWGNWTTYKFGTYTIFLGQADAAVRAAGGEPGGILEGATEATVEGVKNTPGLREIGNAIQFFTVGRNWGRIGMITLGGILLIVALGTLARPAVEPIIKTAAKVA